MCTEVVVCCHRAHASHKQSRLREMPQAIPEGETGKDTQATKLKGEKELQGTNGREPGIFVQREEATKNRSESGKKRRQKRGGVSSETETLAEEQDVRERNAKAGGRAARRENELGRGKDERRRRRARAQPRSNDSPGSRSALTHSPQNRSRRGAFTFPSTLPRQYRLPVVGSVIIRETSVAEW